MLPNWLFNVCSFRYCLLLLLVVVAVVVVVVWLIWFFTSHQQSFIYIGTGLPVLNQCLHVARINVSCSGTQHSDAGEARTRGPSVSSQASYHWATALPNVVVVVVVMVVVVAVAVVVVVVVVVANSNELYEAASVFQQRGICCLTELIIW